MSRLLALCFAILASGCALQTEHIDLAYVPTPSAPLPGASGRSVAVLAREGRNTDPQVVSVKKNGYGMELGDLVANQPVLGLVQSAVAQELAARGFNIGSGGATVDVELEKFYADFKNGFLTISSQSEVNILVQVRQANGQVVYTRVIHETARPNGSLLGTPSLARESLDAALQAAVSTLFHDAAFLAAVQGARGTPSASLRITARGVA